MSRIKALFIATGLLLLMGAVLWVSSRSVHIPTVTLADGTVLRMEAVTFGKKHTFATEPKWKRDLRRRLPNFIQPIFGPPGYLSEVSWRDDHLVLWLSQYDPVKNRYLMPAYDGCFIKAENGEEFRVGHSSSGDDGSFKEKHFVSQVFPRRQKTFTVRFEKEGKSVELAVPNPHVWTGPEWTAQSLPQTQTVDQVSYVLKQMHAYFGDDGENSFTPHFEVYAEGEDRTEWYLPKTMLVDVTGNTDYNNLFTSEPVWKVQTSFFRTAKAKFAKDEVIPLAKLTLPESGKYEIIQITEELKSQGVKFLALTGPGLFTFQNDQCISAQPWEKHMRETSSSSTGDTNWTYRFGEPEGRLILVSEHTVPQDYDHNRNDQFLLIRARPENGEFTQASAQGWSSMQMGTRLVMIRKFDLKEFPKDQELQVDLIPQTAVQVEYLVQPPKKSGQGEVNVF